MDLYLSRAHRRRACVTCPLLLLVGDAERLPDAARSSLAESLAGLTALGRRHLSRAGREAPEEQAHSVLAVGALALARAELDPETSGARLEHSRRAIRSRLGVGPPPAEGGPQAA